ncbi:MAG: histidinol-phosphatase HisJ family protein [Candidatus Cloacimonas sp.]|nr:histidinol-phosphatase HisJ family protein [Candidatus Cloacimonas sp.]
MKFDYHLHTEDSYDSSLKAIDLLKRAIQLKYDEIAITEHLDLLPLEMRTYGVPSLNRYYQRIKELKSRTSEINVLIGIEVGDYQRVKNYASVLVENFAFDLILGSVHFLSDNTNVAIPLPKPLSEEQVKDYYLQNLALVSSCDIDVLAHLGVYKRCYDHIPDETIHYSLLHDIFQTMIQRGIALEINYSPLRRGYPSFIPELPLLEMYLNLGGKLFSLGSDAHQIEHFDLYRDTIPHNFCTSYRYLQ